MAQSGECLLGRELARRKHIHLIYPSSIYDLCMHPWARPRRKKRTTARGRERGRPAGEEEVTAEREIRVARLVAFVGLAWMCV